MKDSDVLEAVSRTHTRLKTKVGYTERERHKQIAAALALDILSESELTIDFHPEEEAVKKIGLDNIWEYIAYTYPRDDDNLPLKQPTDRERWESVEQHAKTIERGFNEVRRHLLGDSRMALYMVPRTKTSNSIRVITVFADYQVNDTETALDIHNFRTGKQLQGQLKSCATKFVAANGAKALPEFNRLLLEITQEIIVRGLPEPRLLSEEAQEAEAVA